VPLTVNSDDPPLFETTLTAEYAALADPMGLDRNQIDEIALNAFRYSFLEPKEKAARLGEAEREMLRLRSAMSNEQ